MKLILIFCFLFLPVFFFSHFAFSIEEEVVFELKREKTKKQNQTKKKKTLPLKFNRQSFSFSEDFLIFNEKPASHIKKGTALRVNIPYPVIASFTEEFPLYAIVIYPFKAVLSGKIKGVKNTNKASVIFDEVIVNGEKTAIESLPVFLNGDLKESLLKDIALNFFDSLPSVFRFGFKDTDSQNRYSVYQYGLTKQNGKALYYRDRKKKKASIPGA